MAASSSSSSLYIFGGSIQLSHSSIPTKPPEKNEKAYQEWQQNVYKIVQEKLDQIAKTLNHTEWDDCLLDDIAAQLPTDPSRSDEETKLLAKEALRSFIQDKHIEINAFVHQGEVPKGSLKDLSQNIPERQDTYTDWRAKLRIFQLAADNPAIASISVCPTHPEKKQTWLISREREASFLAPSSDYVPKQNLPQSAIKKEELVKSGEAIVVSTKTSPNHSPSSRPLPPNIQITAHQIFKAFVLDEETEALTCSFRHSSLNTEEQETGRFTLVKTPGCFQGGRVETPVCLKEREEPLMPAPMPSLSISLEEGEGERDKAPTPPRLSRIFSEGSSQSTEEI
jgi:hypothetical protein